MRFLPTLTLDSQDTLFHFDGTSGFIPQLVQTPNRKADDGFPKIGSYFFSYPGESQNARNGETVCLSSSKKGGRGDQGGQSSQNTHSGFGNEAISLPTTLHTFIPPRPLSRFPTNVSPSTLATPVRQQSTRTMEFLCAVAGEKRKFSPR